MNAAFINKDTVFIYKDTVFMNRATVFINTDTVFINTDYIYGIHTGICIYHSVFIKCVTKIESVLARLLTLMAPHIWLS